MMAKIRILGFDLDRECSTVIKSVAVVTKTESGLRIVGHLMPLGTVCSILSSSASIQWSWSSSCRFMTLSNGQHFGSLALAHLPDLPPSYPVSSRRTSAWMTARPSSHLAIIRGPLATRATLIFIREHSSCFRILTRYACMSIGFAQLLFYYC